MPNRDYIICVDDERTVLDSLRQELHTGLQKQYRIEIADSGEDALELFEEIRGGGEQVPVVISDQLMPGMKGDEFLIEIHNREPITRKILLTGQATADSVGNVVNRAGLYRFIPKPWDKDDLILTVQQAVKSYFNDQKLDAYVKQLNRLNTYANLLSKELHFLSWIQVFLTRVIEDTGAEIGLLSAMLEGQPFYIRGRRVQGQVQLEEMEPQQVEETFPHRFLNKVYQTGEIFVFNRVDRNEQPPEELDGYQAYLSAPLQKDQQILGVITLAHTSNPQLFDALNLEFITSLVAQVPISLDNALLYESLERKVQERTQTIEQQKYEIELQNERIESFVEDLTDSIKYARRIQYAILPPRDLLNQLFPDYFILYEPKDIVSGDFYWFTRIDQYLFLSAVDCTGHGVPGAFMSVLGNSFLNQIVKERRIFDTGEILGRLHQEVFSTLRMNVEEGDGLEDGMDMALCRLDLQTGGLQYSGAMRPLVLFLDGELREIKPTKTPIGGSIFFLADTRDPEFEVHELSLQKGDTFYMFSDGITDQFGGERKRKFTPSQLLETLKQNQAASMAEQGQILHRLYVEWRGDLEQTDDILVMGFRMTT